MSNQRKTIITKDFIACLCIKHIGKFRTEAVLGSKGWKNLKVGIIDYMFAISSTQYYPWILPQKEFYVEESLGEN